MGLDGITHVGRSAVPSTAVADRVSSSQAAVVALFKARLDRAVSDGQLPGDRDTAALARFLYNTNLGLVVQARAGATPDELRSVADLAIASVLG